MSFPVLSIQKLQKDRKVIMSPSLQRRYHNVHSGEHVLKCVLLDAVRTKLHISEFSASTSVLSSHAISETS